MRLLNIKYYQYYQSKLEMVGSNDLFLVSYDYYSNVWKSCKSKNKANKNFNLNVWSLKNWKKGAVKKILWLIKKYVITKKGYKYHDSY